MVKARPTSVSNISPPGTRSRRVNETERKQGAKSRLSSGQSNGCINSSQSTSKGKFDQITTRSRAAEHNDSSSSTRKRRELQLHNNSIIINNNCANSANGSAIDAELKRLHISMKLSHDDKVTHSCFSPPISTKSSNATSNHQGNQLNRTKYVSSSKRSTSASISNSSDANGLDKSSKKGVRSAKNENNLNHSQHDFSKHNRKRKISGTTGQHRSRSSKDQVNQCSDDDNEDCETADSENTKNRKSALWVLNYEAEEFLFGETAADKHEPLLPPKPVQPPAKKRRMRATELGDLLKETPLLPSKLRKHSSGSETSQASSLTLSMKDDKLSSGASKRRANQNNDSSDYVPYESDVDVGSSSELMVLTTSNTPSITSCSSCVGSPPIIHDFAQSVRLQGILGNLDLRFSFEDVPSNEIWYKTFSRQESPNKSFQFRTAESPVVLPYERSSLSARSFGKFSKLPRKSPRCHASTLAILSALKPTRGRRASGGTNVSGSTNSGPSSPSSPCDSFPQTPTSSRHISSSRHCSPSKPCSSSSIRSTSTGSLNSRRWRNLSSPRVAYRPLPPLQNNMNDCDLIATEYMWDALRFLEDPYVLQILAETEPSRPLTSSKQPKLASPTTRSTRKERSSPNKQMISPTPKLVSSPKTSPKLLLQNGSHNAERELLLMTRSPPLSPKGSSRPSSPLSPPASPSGTRNVKRKSPIVLVSDVFKGLGKPNSLKNGAINGFGHEEEVLFLSGDTLPPLPPL